MQGVYEEFFGSLINNNKTATEAYHAAAGKLCTASAVLRDGNNVASELNCAAGGGWIYMYMYRGYQSGTSELASVFTSPSGIVLIAFSVVMPTAFFTVFFMKKKQRKNRSEQL